MKCHVPLVVALALTVALARPAGAQPVPRVLDRPASIGLLGGFSAGSGDAGGSVRPDVRALVVFGDGDRLTITTMTFALGYRF